MCTCLTGLPEFFLAGPSLRNAQLGRLTNHHRDALMIERLAIRASQGDFVGAGPERELFRLGYGCCVTVVDIYLGSSMVRVDLDFTIVRSHVGIRVRIWIDVVREEWIESLHDDYPSRCLRPANRGAYAQQKSADY